MLSVIVDDTRDPARNLALDEAMLRAAAPAPLLRVWRSDPCVIIGRSQRPATAVDLATCARYGVPVLRRGTGGGAVVLGPGSLNLSVVEECPQATPGAALRIADTVLSDLTGRFGVPLARSAVLTTRQRILVHATVRACDAVSDARSVDALHAAVLAVLLERYGLAGTRGLTETEIAWCDSLLTRRYHDLGWHLGSSCNGLVRVGQTVESENCVRP